MFVRRVSLSTQLGFCFAELGHGRLIVLDGTRSSNGAAQIRVTLGMGRVASGALTEVGIEQVEQQWSVDPSALAATLGSLVHPTLALALLQSVRGWGWLP